MKQQGHRKRTGELREAMQTRTLIADISRIDIVSEEEAAGVADLARSDYPTLARDLRARRDNLLETIAALRPPLV